MSETGQSDSQESATDRFEQRYGAPVSGAMEAIQREVFGANVGVNGYTTIAQADALAERLELRPGMRLLDVGAGRGWPGLYLAQKTACEVVVTDVPVAGIRSAHTRARERGLLRRASCIVASGTHLPFRSRSFDAAVHTDVL
jgi:2-polyprenyl-3-methyl-5-hydroxy-6-metoxy-1,4-benzoquinol methylase